MDLQRILLFEMQPSLDTLVQIAEVLKSGCQGIVGVN